MNKIFVLGVVVILSGSMMLPAVIGSEDMDEKITVRVRTSPGTISEREVSPVVGTRLQSMISQLNNHTDKYRTLLPALLSILEDCGLIENAEKMELAIKKRYKKRKRFNVESTIIIFQYLLFCSRIRSRLDADNTCDAPLKITSSSHQHANIFYQTLRPRLFVPLGGWLVAEGK